MNIYFFHNYHWFLSFFYLILYLSLLLFLQYQFFLLHVLNNQSHFSSFSFLFSHFLFLRGFYFIFFVTFMFSTVYSRMWSSPTSYNNIFKELEKWESRRRWSSKQDFFFVINWGLFDSVLFRDNLIWCHVIFPKKQKLTYNYFI